MPCRTRVDALGSWKCADCRAIRSKISGVLPLGGRFAGGRPNAARLWPGRGRWGGGGIGDVEQLARFAAEDKQFLVLRRVFVHPRDGLSVPVASIVQMA